MLSNPAHWPTDLSGVDDDMVCQLRSSATRLLVVPPHRIDIGLAARRFFLRRSEHLEQYTVICSNCFVVAVIQDRTKDTSLNYTTILTVVFNATHASVISGTYLKMID